MIPDHDEAQVMHDGRIPDSLEDPGPPIVLTVKVAFDGSAHTQYTIAPADAIQTLRNIATQIEKEVAEKEQTEAIDRLHGPGAAAALDDALADGSVFSDSDSDLHAAYLES